MKFWLVVASLVLGMALGAAGVLLLPDLVTPYLPEGMRGDANTVDGKVVAKQKDVDRLLLTVLTEQGATLATFRRKVAEINLLVEEEDTVSFVLRQYKPFVTDPRIKRVMKGRSPYKPENKGSPTPLSVTKPTDEPPRPYDPPGE